MENKHKIIVWAGLILILAVMLYAFNSKDPVLVNENIPIVKSEDIKGCYVSKLSKDVYVLSIDSEKDGIVSGKLAFNNYEKDSSSGAFTGTYKDGILLANYVFASEGMNSEVQVIFKKEGEKFVRGFGVTSMTMEGIEYFEDLTKINYDPNSTFIKSNDCREIFTEASNKFTFQYNPFFKVFQRDQSQNVPDTDWRVNTKQKGMQLAHVSIPKVFMPGTNFSNAYMTIGASTDPKEIKSCGTIATNGEIKAGTVTINGYPFTKFTLGDAGAGNFYETTSYRGLLDGDCYAIEYTIHSTNIGAYSPDQGIKEFDKVKVTNEFESIIASFKFLVNSN
jgi:hypothetical protein